ncbi:MAG: TIGR02449 family protein [Parahaliea sp.]
MTDNPLKALESKIDQLIALCRELNQENQELKTAASHWQRERQDLVNKNELACDKVEAVLNRLRAME